MMSGVGGSLAAIGAARYGRRTMLAAAGILPVIAYFGMAAFLGWRGIALGLLLQFGYGMGQVLFLNAINERIASGVRATVISMASLGVRACFSLLGPLVGFGIDGWGLPWVLTAIGILSSSPSDNPSVATNSPMATNETISPPASASTPNRCAATAAPNTSGSSGSTQGDSVERTPAINPRPALPAPIDGCLASGQ